MSRSAGPVRAGICIPAFDECEGLRTLLSSVHRLDHPPELVHVVVAVDGADPAVVAVAEEFGATTVRLVVNKGSYAARNAAVDALPEVDIVLFADADCVLAPAWIHEHQRILDDHDLSGGAVHFTFRGARPTPAEFVDSMRHLQQKRYVEIEHYAATCNLAVRPEVLRRMRFDPAMRTGGDADFGRRAHDLGLTIGYAEAAFVEHPARVDRKALLTKVRRIASGVGLHRARWEERGRPQPARINRGIYRLARAQGHDVSWWWGLRATMLNVEATRTINRAVDRLLAGHP